MTLTELYQLYLQYPYVSIDSRKVPTNSLFFAVGRKNEEGIHRGCQFAALALEAGAAAVVINDPKLKALHANDKRWIWVEDVEMTLQQLGRHHRQQLDIPVIAIAGSNGKTTTRALIRAVLAERYQCFATPGNLNNQLGVPLSLLQIGVGHQIAILELGANHLGETYYLSQLVQPTMGLVTNCGKDHLGEYGSYENIVKANKELYDYLAQTEGIVWVNGRDETLIQASEHCRQRFFYGADDNTVRADILNSPFLELRVWVNDKAQDLKTVLFGDFWRDSVLAAVQIGYYFGMSLEEMLPAIAAYRPDALRSQMIDWQGNVAVLDCYNANPSSMEAFVRAAQSSPESPKILILGEMLELGAYSQEEHQYLLDKVIDYQKFESVILVGLSFLEVNIPQLPQLLHFRDAHSALAYWPQKSWADKPPCFIYVKGSRGNKLEQLFGVQ